MRCLWLTFADPDPRHDGQLVYSGGLIDAVSACGVELDVLAMNRPGALHMDGEIRGNINWWIAEGAMRPPLSAFLSRYPNVANQSHTFGMQRRLRRLLGRHHYDAVIFDGIAVGWGLQPVLDFFPEHRRRPRLVYVSHNHETSMRAEIARQQPRPLRRTAMRYDALKVAHLERRLIDHADLITAITPVDAELYRAKAPSKTIAVLTPGYGGRAVPQKRLDASLPRRAIIVGSFDWIAKRMNIESFVRAADPLFAAHGIELQVVGSADEVFLNRLRAGAMATRFTGAVTDLSRYMDEARIAIVPERHGGGFKLKVLDYVFNRLPIAGLEHSVAGMPLMAPDSILLYGNIEALARGVAAVIDDFDLLGRIQERAFTLCHDRFDWRQRGEQLLSAVNAL